MLRVLALVFGLTSMAATASQLPEYPFVYTVGNARMDAAPDMVRLSFTVAARNKDLKVASGAVDSTFNSVVAALAAAAIRDADIDASAVDKTPLNHWDQNSNQTIADGYEVSRKVTVTGHDLAKYPQMARALLELPNTQNFNADFDRSDRARLRADLRVSAARDAKARAEEMATQFGRKLGPVRAISQITFPAIPGEFGFSSAGAGIDDRMFKRSVPVAAQFLAPATIPISETVNAIYELQ